MLLLNKTGYEIKDLVSCSDITSCSDIVYFNVTVF